MVTSMLRLRRVQPADGPLLKKVRLAALRDAPDAFGSTLADEADRSDEEWADWAASASTGSGRITVLAERSRDVVGLAGGYREEPSPTTVELVSMWVSPEARRAGVGRALVNAIIDWARFTEGTEVGLWVTKANVAAEHLYGAIGFSASGQTQRLPSNPELDEVRMVIHLP